MIIIIVICVVVRASAHSSSNSDPHRTLSKKDLPLLMISFDGFRPDYLERLRQHTTNRSIKNNFDELIEAGVNAPHGMHNVFTTQTFPNHYSLATGLYEESHGIVANHFWDPATNSTVQYPNLPSDGRYFGGQPIWETFGRQRGLNRVACFSWVGCTSIINGFVLPAVVPYYADATCDQHLTMLHVWLANHMQFVLMYFNQPDADGHKYGPLSNEVLSRLLQLNECLGRILQLLSARGLWPAHMNVLLVSDHGMQTVTKKVYVPHKPDMYKMRSIDSVLMMADPIPGREQQALSYLRALSNVTVYAKSEGAIPERWHYAHNDRVRELLLVADPGVQLVSEQSQTTQKGTHGWDTADKKMRPIFIASGPAFKQKKTIEDEGLQSVDVYLLICTLFALQAAPNNGSIKRINQLFNHDYLLSLSEADRSTSSGFQLATGASVVWLSSIWVFVFVCVAFLAHCISKRNGQRKRSKLTEMNRINLENKVLLSYQSASDDDEDADVVLSSRH